MPVCKHKLTRAIAFAAIVEISCPTPVSAGEALDDLMLGTWKATGVSEERCYIRDVTVTLRVFEKTDDGLYMAHHLERGVVTTKPECEGEKDSDRSDAAPVIVGGGEVFVELSGERVRIWSDDPRFHAETLTRVDKKMIGADDMGGIEYIKTFSELRYDAREDWLGWNAICVPLSDAERLAMDAVADFASEEALRSVFKTLFEGDLRSVTSLQGESINPVEQFDGMTSDEILRTARDNVIAFLERDLRSSLDKIAACTDGSEEEITELSDNVAKRKAQREAFEKIGDGSR